ncbi:MAG: DNA-3-methyladenine glycosylase [Candidatus Rokubacteria bacterium]|nr:DNA-3-methyladenine glycosylase [Candidatus Rokubacteria bacterium]
MGSSAHEAPVPISPVAVSALPRGFYRRAARAVARDLLGCVLVSRIGRSLTAGRIVETEAYLGPEDAASHAAFRPSSRALFYGDGGYAYVFRVYGIHVCLNAITGAPGAPGCVLVRAVEPVIGVAAMARRRGIDATSVALTNGPGKLTQALGITPRENGTDLTSGRLVIEPPDAPRDFAIASGPRIGITRAADLPLRFSVRGNRYVSRG